MLLFSARSLVLQFAMIFFFLFDFNYAYTCQTEAKNWLTNWPDEHIDRNVT